MRGRSVSRYLRRSGGRVASWWVSGRRLGLVAASDEAGSAEQQRVGVQGLDQLRAFGGGEVGDPRGHVLSLDVEVGEAGVWPELPTRAIGWPSGDLLTDAARAEVTHHQVVAVADVDH